MSRSWSPVEGLSLAAEGLFLAWMLNLDNTSLRSFLGCHVVNVVMFS